MTPLSEHEIKAVRGLFPLDGPLPRWTEAENLFVELEAHGYVKRGTVSDFHDHTMKTVALPTGKLWQVLCGDGEDTAQQRLQQKPLELADMMRWLDMVTKTAAEVSCDLTEAALCEKIGHGHRLSYLKQALRRMHHLRTVLDGLQVVP